MKELVATKTFVEFVYVGSLFNNYREKEVVKRDFKKQVVPEEAFAFCYYDVDYFSVINAKGKERIGEGKPYNYSPNYYPGGKYISRQDLEGKEEYKILLNNMIERKKNRVIKTRFGNFQFFKKGDRVLPEKQKSI